jgi:nucleoside-diphosphate-sugar epimerase
LVTGATGFIGSHLARRLLEEGSEVHALVRAGARLDRIPDLAARLRMHEDDGGPLDAVVAEAAPVTTFHLATWFLTTHRADQVGGLVAANVGFPARLLDALATTGNPRFVNAGTAWQAAPGRAARNLYAATKDAFEAILDHYAERGGVEAATVVLNDTYGPHDHRGKVIDALVRSLGATEPLEMSSGRQRLDLLHVQDVVDGLLAAAHALGPGHQRFALRAAETPTLREVVDRLGAVAGQVVPVAWGARPDPGSDAEPRGRELPAPPGWSPQVGLDAGLADLVRPDRG